MFPPSKLCLRMLVRDTMQVAKPFKNFLTSRQSKRKITIGAEFPLCNGLLQERLDGLEVRVAPVPTRILKCFASSYAQI